jgi:hypothetical protein
MTLGFPFLRAGHSSTGPDRHTVCAALVAASASVKPSYQYLAGTHFRQQQQTQGQ